MYQSILHLSYNFPVTFDNLSDEATFLRFTKTCNPFPLLYFIPVLSQMIVTILPWYKILSRQNQSHLPAGNSGFTSITLSALGLRPIKPVIIRSLKVE